MEALSSVTVQLRESWAEACDNVKYLYTIEKYVHARSGCR